MCNIDAVLFDLDGVLVDACEWHYESLNKALKDSGYDIINRESHISTYNGLPTKIKLKMLGLSNNMIEYINLQKQKYTLEIITNTAKTMPEKVELHRYLQSKNIKIGCVTNSIKETTEHMLRSTGQFEYIDIIVTNEDVNNNKPYPDCYNFAIDKLKANPKNVLCVEDSEIGIQAAKASIAHHLFVVRDTYDVNINTIKKEVENN